VNRLRISFAVSMGDEEADLAAAIALSMGAAVVPVVSPAVPAVAVRAESVMRRGERWAGADDDGGSDAITLLSWNVLADCYATQGDADYDHVDPGALAWPARCAALLAEIGATDATLVCLQEVMLRAFEEELAPALAARGYDGRMQRKPGDKTHPQGVATFWKRDAFELAEPGSAFDRSRASGMVLRERRDRCGGASGRLLALVNVHLEGHPSASTARVKQLQGALRELRKHGPHHALLVAGDFNCQLQGSACASWLAFDAVLPGTWDMGHVVERAATALEGHGYAALASTYQPPPPPPPPPSGGGGGYSDVVEQGGHFVDALGRTHPDCKSFTFCGWPGRPVEGLDQIWFTPQSLACVARRELWGSDEQRRAAIVGGLPNAANPSDHVPIGAAFRWLGGGGALADVRPAAKGTAAAAAHGGAGGGGGADCGVAWSAGEALAQADSLLAACPFATQEQRNEFDAATSEVGGVPAKGKPPPEVIAELKARQARLQRLLAAVSPEARQMLERVQALRRKAKKKQQPHASPQDLKEKKEAQVRRHDGRAAGGSS
jgi:mRNA deadenylase 3'-5' endonuclease subunit Ccr4